MSAMRYEEAPEEACAGFVEQDGEAVAIIWESHEIGRLFAAAPELLASLIATLPVIDDAESDARQRALAAIGTPHPEFEDKWNRVADCFAKQASDIRALIAKVAGKETAR